MALVGLGCTPSVRATYQADAVLMLEDAVLTTQTFTAATSAAAAAGPIATGAC